MKLNLKKRRGLSLLEVVIVITLMGILTAVIMPSFMNSQEKAKLKSDIASAQIIQSAIDLHNVEQNEQLPDDVDEIIKKLSEKKYLKQSEYSPQTANSTFVVDGDMIKLDISGNENKKELLDSLEEQLQEYIKKVDEN